MEALARLLTIANNNIIFVISIQSFLFIYSVQFNWSDGRNIDKREWKKNMVML